MWMSILGRCIDVRTAPFLDLQMAGLAHKAGWLSLMANFPILFWGSPTPRR